MLHGETATRTEFEDEDDDEEKSPEDAVRQHEQRAPSS